MDNLVYIQTGNTRPSRRLTRWLLLGAALVLLLTLISGCGGGSANIAPLSPLAFEATGKEMTAIEKVANTSPGDLAIIARLTPAEIELIETLPLAKLANLTTVTDADVSNIPLGTNLAVINSLTPAQLTFIRSLKNVDQLDALKNLTQRRLNALDALIAQDKNANVELTPQFRQGFSSFWLGYIAETRATLNKDVAGYAEANLQYQQAVQAGGGFGAQARYRLGVLGINNLIGPQSGDLAKTNLQVLQRSTPSIGSGKQETILWVRTPVLAGQDGPAKIGGDPPTFKSEDAPTAANFALDKLFKNSVGLDGWYYRVVDAYVSWFKHLSPGYGAALALIFLSLLIKLVTTPLTTASFRGMRDMQRVQPMIKELQEKYKNDKQKLAEEQMKLMKEHKVSPLGGCLPMLIQLPIFIVVYRAVQVYAAGFADSHFLWIHNLARPDIPLLILYALSMIVTQKLTAAPATDPQQKMMQTQMTYFMPIFLLLVLNSIASAFVLYWFFLNVFSSIHQYYLVNKFKKEDEARGIIAPITAKPTPSTKKKGKSS